MLKLTLPFPPSVNRLWRAGKAGNVYRSKQYVTWRNEALASLLTQKRAERFNCPYKLTVWAVKPDKRKRDIGNLEKSVSDILVSAGIIEDDHLCHWIELKWVDDGPPCTVILEKINGEEK
jgi:crossover junction endodeoxyribonuclease RusA